MAIETPHPAGADELLELAGIAARFGVARGTVDTWRHRGRGGHPFPAPELLHGRRPRWNAATVDAWAAAAGVPALDELERRRRARRRGARVR